MMSRNKGKGRRVRKFCIYCARKFEPDFKAYDVLRRIVNERGKILPRRISGLCAMHQRRAAIDVKKARHLALLPFVAESIR